ncbi:MAG: GPP34 family phosphoprotein [Bacteroidota bacterium]
MHTLSLKEQFTLLAIHDDKGHFLTSSHLVNLGVLSAALLDEVLAQRLRVRAGQIELIEPPTAEIDRILHTALREQPKALVLKKTMHQLTKTGGEIKELILQQLIKKDILRKEEGKVFWVFNTKKWQTEDPMPEVRLKARLHHILIDGKTPSTKELMILQITEACGLIKAIFPDLKDRKKASKRLKTLKSDNPIAEELSQSLQEAIAEIITVSTAIMVTTTMVQ